MEIYYIKLAGGLCNKLFHLISACDIAIKEGKQILEPHFGWKKQILFSDIYDIKYFNHMMKSYNNDQDIMVSIKDKEDYTIIDINNVITEKYNYINIDLTTISTNNLWTYSNYLLQIQRNLNTIDLNDSIIAVLNSVKLNNYNIQFANSIKQMHRKSGIHIRIEKDWKRYMAKKKCKIIKPCRLIKMYKKKFNHKVFFTTGENQRKIKKQFSNHNIQTQFFFNKELEYEINAAINFELCSKAKLFIGTTKSTFSNLITLKRSLNNINESYIYDNQTNIVKRIDKGLHCSVYNAINNEVSFTNII